MKKIVIIVGSVIVAIGSLILLVLYLTAPLPETAEKFFVLVQKNEIESAYQSTAPYFQQATSYDDFFTFIDTTGLKEIKSTAWYSRSIHNNTGKLQGEIQLKDGTRLNTDIDFINERGTWKIVNLHVNSGGSSNTAYTPPAPPTEEVLQELTRSTMRTFAAATATGKFDDFYGFISKSWQSQTSAAELATAFADFSAHDLNASFVSGEPITWDEPPSIDERGLLQLRGHYFLNNRTTTIEQSYMYEDSHWRLFGIRIRLN